jgi:hypothetical protein
VPDSASLPAVLWTVGVGGLGLTGYVATAESGIGCADFRAHWGLDPGGRGDLAVVVGVAWQKDVRSSSAGCEFPCLLRRGELGFLLRLAPYWSLYEV